MPVHIFLHNFIKSWQILEIQKAKYLNFLLGVQISDKNVPFQCSILPSDTTLPFQAHTWDFFRAFAKYFVLLSQAHLKGSLRPSLWCYLCLGPLLSLIKDRPIFQLFRAHSHYLKVYKPRLYFRGSFQSNFFQYKTQEQCLVLLEPRLTFWLS